ncbi:MAG: DUF4129 domain-containing protein [Gracilimonas sp.]|uniref:DUF4129 domain-containing protein n=1 Tax=Gracilimonas TaxID=649462 RepID=UPI001B015E4C|nr:DUF4129 domain-containing protein [Gracilimonas sp.]MBO6585865.1 DUF4129 domain-containing protein [Gracilimonas sp.]MBO6616862.1 DUF4129 domain-containing protein [Gracilimonas sp.]
MIRRLLFIFLFLIPAAATAQDSSTVQHFEPDSSKVYVRTVEPSTLDSLTNEDVFAYNEEAENPETLWSRIQRWFIQLLQWIFSSPWASITVRVIFFAIFGAILFALINHMLGGNLTSSFSRKKTGQSLAMNIRESELSKTNYEEMLQAALAESRYRDAVRILYLKALQQLNENELISWKPDKTNHDYLRELGSHPAGNYFNKLTTYYEYVEYGDFNIEQAGYETVESVYQQFKNQAHA